MRIGHKIVLILVVIYLINGLVHPLAIRTIPCGGGACFPERPYVYPMLSQIHNTITGLMFIPMLPFLFLVNKTVTYPNEFFVLYLFALLSWVIYVVAFRYGYMLVRRLKK